MRKGSERHQGWIKDDGDALEQNPIKDIQRGKFHGGRIFMVVCCSPTALLRSLSGTQMTQNQNLSPPSLTSWDLLAWFLVSDLPPSPEMWPQSLFSTPQQQIWSENFTMMLLLRNFVLTLMYVSVHKLLPTTCLFKLNCVFMVLLFDHSTAGH